MTTPLLTVGSSYDQPPSSRRFIGFAAVVALHVFLVYALASGLARNVVEIVKRPLETKLIIELPPLPPPPPPPKEMVKPQAAAKSEVAPPPPTFVPPPEVVPPSNDAPPLQATQLTPPAVPVAPVEVAPAVETPPAPAKPEHLSVEGSCPGHADTLRKAFAGLYDKYGVAGQVTVRVLVRGNAIAKVTVLSGPREYHRAVVAAVSSLGCQVSGGAEGYFELPIVFREDAP